METTLSNFYIDVVDVTTAPTNGAVTRSVRLTQSRLCLFLSSNATGQPLVALPLFVEVECAIRYRSTPAQPGDIDTAELSEEVYTARVPLGLLGTDHLGFASYNLAALSDLVSETDFHWKTLTAAQQTTFQSALKDGTAEIALRAIWIHPYGDFAFNGLRPGLFSIRPDAIVVNAYLAGGISTSADARKAGIPSMQEPSIIEWRLSPGSFAIAPLLLIGDDECARFTPASVALETYYFNRVVLDAPERVVPQTPAPTPSTPKTTDPATPAPTASRPASPPAAGMAQGPSTRIAAAVQRAALAPALVPNAITAPSAAPVDRLGMKQATIHVYKTQWFQLGHSLGKVLYSLALAPGENSDIAIIDWSREDQAVRGETTAVTEELIADLRRDRTIGEVIDGIVNEKQEGGSTIGAGSLVGGAATSSGGSGGMLGLALSIGGGSAWSSGHRDLHLADTQTLADRISQASSAVRELRSTVVVSSTQKEQNALVTRNITNYNHSHTLTVLYYELLRHLRVVTEFDRSYEAVLVKFPQLAIDRTDPTSLFPYLTFLKGRLLDSTLAGCFDDYADFEIENGRPDPLAVSTNDQDTMVTGILGTVEIRPHHASDGAKNFMGFSVIGSSGDVSLSLSSSISIKPNNSFDQVINVDQFFPIPQFGNELFGAANDVNQYIDDTYSNVNTVDFPLLFSAPVRWGDLAQIRLQCVFQDADTNRNFRVSVKTLGGLTASGTIDLTQPHDFFMFQNLGTSNVQTNLGYISDTLVYPLRMAAPPPPPRLPFDRLTPEAQRSILKLLNHIADNIATYSLFYWLDHDVERMAFLHALGTAFDGSFYPETTLGDYLVFPKLTPNSALPDEMVVDERLITLPTRGVFADAQLGSCNVSEIIDPTRFWDWQTSPIPFQAPSITGVQPQPDYQPPAGVQPSTFPNPIVAIQNAPAAPDPAMAAGLQALTAPNIFRDMSIAKEVAGVISDVTKAATQVAVAAGNLAKSTAGSGGGGTAGGTPQSGGTSSAGSPVSSGGAQQSSNNPQSGNSGTGGGSAPPNTMGGGSTSATQQNSGGTTSAKPASNANQFWVKVALGATNYVASSINLGAGLASGSVTVVSADYFTVSYPIDTPDATAIELNVVIYEAAQNPQTLQADYATSTQKPLSSLRGLTLIPRIADVTFTAKSDMTSANEVQDVNNWTWTVTGTGKVDLPQISGTLGDKANSVTVQGAQNEGQLGGSYGQSGSTSTKTSTGTLFSKGATFTQRFIDFSEPAKFDQVVATY